MQPRITWCIQGHCGFAYELLTVINNTAEIHRTGKSLFMRAAYKQKAGGTETTVAHFLC